MVHRTIADVTRDVKFACTPDQLVEISDSGLIRPLANGKVQIQAQWQNATTELTLEVRGIDETQVVSFPNQVTPILTKLSCNGGGCHGKAAGQNGFKLSLLGFDPKADYERLVRESKGRRVSRAAPDQSLLLVKATNESPHGGGQRLEKDSHEYRLLRRWIAQGTPYTNGKEKQIQGIRVSPAQRRVQPGSKQQLAVLADYTDGSIEDITRAAVFESNDTEMAEVDETGLVNLGELAGDVAVMARYQGQVGVFRADVPLGATDRWTDDKWPKPNNVIDVHVYAKLKSLGIPPAEVCDDASFIRRVTLDIAGRLPGLVELREFLQASNPQKRSKLVDRLLNSDDYAFHFARKWSLILRNGRRPGELELRNMIFHDWIVESLRTNKPYDQFVRELVTASGSVSSNPAVAWWNHVKSTNERIEDTSQLFLGQRIACARCHHHPYEKWSQQDYGQMTAFYSLVTSKGGEDARETQFVSRLGKTNAKPLMEIPNLQNENGQEKSTNIGQDPREALAQWMTHDKNPFFASSLANRYWKHFMGRGLVEPEDDMRVTNPPSNPELLSAMAKELVNSGYDMKALIRLICNSKSYQSSNQANEHNLADKRSYSRFYPKRLTAEVLLDAVDQVCLTQTSFAGMPNGTKAIQLPDSGFNNYFLTVFGQPLATTACECERMQEANLAQSLHLLNSDEMQKKLSADSGRGAILAKDSRGDDEKVTELYLIALGRSPKKSELQAALHYLTSNKRKRLAYEDLIWTLMNSKEFMFNH